MHPLKFGALIACLVALIARPALAATRATQVLQLRGLGRIAVTSKPFPAMRASWVTFAAQDPEHAKRCASKFVADLTGFGGIKSLSTTTLPGSVLALDGSAYWLIGTQGAACQVLCARSLADMALLARQSGAKAWSAVQPSAYPQWLDCMDNHAVGFWFLGGGVMPLDVNADFKWLGDQGLSACVVGTDEARLVAPGVIDTSIADWYSAKAHEANVPYRMLLSWTRPMQPPMLFSRIPLPYVTADPGTVPFPDFDAQQNEVFNGFVPIPAADPYTLGFRTQMAAYAGKDPMFMGHHGEAELGGVGLVDLSRYVGMPSTSVAWHDYLRDEVHLTLAQVGLRYRGNAKAFATWDDVPVPRMRDFVEGGDGSINLAGTWEGHVNAGHDNPGESWKPVECNDTMLLGYGTHNSDDYSDFWIRRTVTLDAKQVAAAKFVHIDCDRWHAAGRLKVGSALVNGTPLKDLTVSHPLWGDEDQCLDLGQTLHVGDNQLVLDIHGPLSYIFLSSVGRWSYPSDDVHKNLFWCDGIDFSSYYKLQTLEDNLKATRAGDPNRPIKIMAPWNFMDRVPELCLKYGAYVHDTGQGGACWGPWLGRYCSWRGVQSSSEPGGPADTPEQLRQHMTFYLMLGNSIVDEVFHAGQYRENPALCKWVADNREMLRCIGKMDMPQPAIGVLRSLRAVRLGFQGPWSWDIARGEAQAAGRTADYVDLPDFATGAADKFRVIVDDDTEVMTSEDVANIAAYVRRGGIFVALHTTGRNTPEAANTWPISALTGLRVSATGISAEQVQFNPKETLFPSLAGQTIKGWGTALDWRNDDSGLVGVAESRVAPDVDVIATWANRPVGSGNVAVATRKLGKGTVVTLGSSFWRDARDINGHWVSRSDMLDQMLTTLGVARESWVTGPKDVNQEIWAEHWRSKNGVFDLYPVARIDTDATKPPLAADIKLAANHTVSSLRDVSVPGAPSVMIHANADSFTMPEIALAPMESHVYAAPRPDIENAALYWIGVQNEQWRMLAPIPARALPPIPPRTSDVLPLAEGWKMSIGTHGSDWTHPAYADAGWKSIKLGSFAAMGIPEDSVAQFRRVVSIPKNWTGQDIALNFDASFRFWGIMPRANLWIDGQPVDVKTLIGDSFVIDLAPFSSAGQITIALQIDGRNGREFHTYFTDRRARPAGATGLFFLQATPHPVKVLPLTDGWYAAENMTSIVPIPVHTMVPYRYLENRFTLPKAWPSSRLFLRSDAKLGWMVLNGNVIDNPQVARSIDVTRLVRRYGENVLRWVPGNDDNAVPPPPAWLYKKPVQNLNLVWTR